MNRNIGLSGFMLFLIHFDKLPFYVRSMGIDIDIGDTD